MIDNKEIGQICQKVKAYWDSVLAKDNDDFSKIAAGKEGGHQLSDKVDQLTTSFIHSQYPTRAGFQHKGNKVSTRSMGDIWFMNKQNEWNPINVKTGLVGSEGQPNIVSLKRVMSSIFEHKIDSYYLLLIKFAMDANGKQITDHQVHLVDMLDWLGKDEDVITFNAGPGQTMLKAKRFFDLLAQKHMPRTVSIREKMQYLMDLYLRGEKILMIDRRRDRKIFKSKFVNFMENADSFSIDQKSQEEFDIK